MTLYLLEVGLNQLSWYTYCNVWAKTLDGKIPEKMPEKFLISDDISPYINRSKNIYKCSSVKTIHVHSPISFTNRKGMYLTNFRMFHFYNWSGKPRGFNLTKLIQNNNNNDINE